MLIASVPAKFLIPWGNSAGGGFIRAIPQASQIGITNGAASLTDGFVPLNFLPVGSGGVPPFGQDMNGILNQITLWNQWNGAGGIAQYDSAFSTAIGGYPQGAILASTTAGIAWLNTVDNNATNPDSSGTNWLQILTASSTSLRLLGSPRVFTSTQVYTPSSGTLAVLVQAQAGGGGGGGAPASGAGTVSCGAPGGGGTYGEGFYTTGFSGVTMTIGSAGAGGVGAAGGTGGQTSFGALLVCPGGGFGQVGGPTSPPFSEGSFQGGISSGGNIVNGAGAPGGISFASSSAGGFGGQGGPGHWGGGGSPINQNTNGQSAVGPGAGGGGTCSINGAGALTGGNGTPGRIIVHEYGF